MSQYAALSEQEVKQLLESPQEKRMRVTDMLSDYYANGGFKPEELTIAGDILSVLAEDMETEVRRYLSTRIKDLDSVPKDIVLNLAKDVAEISVSVLEFSSLLTDEDLVEIVSSTKNAEKLIAVSRRDTVSEHVSAAIIEQGVSEATLSLLQNAGADISENGLERVLDFHEDEAPVQSAMCVREALPFHVVERLVSSVSEKMRDQLAEKYRIDSDILTSLIRDTNDIAAVNLAASSDSRAMYERYNYFMKKHKFPSLFGPVMALCLGNQEIFVILAAKALQTPMINIRYVVEHNTDGGFKELYHKLKLNNAWCEPCNVLAGVLRELNEKYTQQELYGDIYMRQHHAKHYVRTYEARASHSCPDAGAVKTISQLLRNTQMLAQKELSMLEKKLR